MCERQKLLLRKMQRTSSSAEKDGELTLQPQQLAVNRAAFDQTWSCGNVQTDAFRSAKCCITRSDFLWMILSILLRLVSCAMNAKLAYDYYRSDDIKYFCWTVLCIIVPMFATMTFYSIVKSGEKDDLIRKSCCQQVSSNILVFHLTRNAKSLYYACKCKRAELQRNILEQTSYYERVSQEDSDVALVRLVECFMEVAPQKILQINIAIKQVTPVTAIQLSLIIIYFINSAWCLLSYHRCIRFAQRDKNNISVIGSVLQFLWHICITVSRTLTISFLTILSPLLGISFWVLRAAITGCIIFFRDTALLRGASTSSNVFVCLTIGAVYLFAYVSIQDGSTFWRYIIHYCWSFLETLVSVAVFFRLAQQTFLLREITISYLCVLALSSFGAGVIFMVIYYKCFHPSKTAKQKPAECFVDTAEIQHELIMHMQST